ncbi:MAG: FKBP-type peptidyl-prolyl cis-trans isomerase [Planctomycetota bacterium]|jgi:FKBP-type peptidyl-prolyl cis-trans isomerase|nr:FKBP-type peptidyl-prolyl cis-trans isomerase [Planctomycetota bacterium]MDP6761846.1 FKBP-type peptidyl-prolyl cis-trans isomerase [Planctomycetota bacterium]MDP6988892.1 FKBP-type peptidyl-prolyl cis-trans isomerase [Planctomycetota bacterium]
MSRESRLLVLCALWLLAGCSSFSRPVEVQRRRVAHPSGVEFEDVVEGVGNAARKGRTVTVDYTAWLDDGTRFDSSLDRGRPVTFVLGEAPVAGWNLGIPGMREGGERRLFVPSEEAYGPGGLPGLVPPDTALVFSIALIEVSPK